MPEKVLRYSAPGAVDRVPIPATRSWDSQPVAGVDSCQSPRIGSAQVSVAQNWLRS